MVRISRLTCINTLLCACLLFSSCSNGDTTISGTIELHDEDAEDAVAPPTVRDNTNLYSFTSYSSSNLSLAEILTALHTEQCNTIEATITIEEPVYTYMHYTAYFGDSLSILYLDYEKDYPLITASCNSARIINDGTSTYVDDGLLSMLYAVDLVEEFKDHNAPEEKLQELSDSVNGIITEGSTSKLVKFDPPTDIEYAFKLATVQQLTLRDYTTLLVDRYMHDNKLIVGDKSFPTYRTMISDEAMTILKPLLRTDDCKEFTMYAYFNNDSCVLDTSTPTTHTSYAFKKDLVSKYLGDDFQYITETEYNELKDKYKVNYER